MPKSKGSSGKSSGRTKPKANPQAVDLERGDNGPAKQGGCSCATILIVVLLLVCIGAGVGGFMLGKKSTLVLKFSYGSESYSLQEVD